MKVPRDKDVNELTIMFKDSKRYSGKEVVKKISKYITKKMGEVTTKKL